MKVDRLVVLYEAVGDTTAESPNSANSLSEYQNQKLADAVAVDEFAKAKQKATPLRSFVLGFSALDEKNAKQTAKGASKGLTKGQSDLAKLVLADGGAAGSKKSSDEKAAGSKKRADEKGAETRKLTWGAYVILHGGGGKATRPASTPENVAGVLKEVEKKVSPKGWKLKKVCIVGCTLGAAPLGQSESWVKKCCDSLQVPDALVGGYTVPVYVSYKDHAQRGPFPALNEEKNWGH